MLDYITHALEKIDCCVQQAIQVAHDSNPNHEGSSESSLCIICVMKGYADLLTKHRAEGQQKSLIYFLLRGSSFSDQSQSPPKPIFDELQSFTSFISVLAEFDSSYEDEPEKLPFLTNTPSLCKPLELSELSEHLSFDRCCCPHTVRCCHV